MLVVLVDVFGMTLVLPLLAIYAETFAATALQASLLVSVFAGCQLVAAPLIGQWSDRIGRKPMLLASQVGTFIGFVVLAKAGALWMVFLGRIIDGITAGNLSLAQSYIADHTAPADRTKAFGMIGMAFGIGLFVGPGVTGILSAQFGLQAPIWLAAVLSLISILCTAALLDNSRSAAPGPRPAMLNWRTYATYFQRPIMGDRLRQFLCYVMSFSMFISGFALFAERRFEWLGAPFGPREIGLVFALVGLVGIVVQGLTLGRMVERYGDARVVAIGLCLLAAGFIGLGLSSSIAVLAVSATALAFGTSVVRPALSSLISQQAGPHEQGLVAGLTTSIVSVAAIVSPIIGGTLIGRGWLVGWAATAASLATLALWLTMRSRSTAPSSAASR